MNPHPLSLHASLEEQWDEEEEPEEIETLLKVVPPAYHQYLDVFCKVKAEKLPPHSACDHQFKLEGLLPPVGVIYSLSNQDSETMWAYISENVERGFIRPSSSSTGSPSLSLKKKDGGLHLCVDHCKLNAITRKNRYPVPPMNQILTVFSGSTIFSKMDLNGAYNLLTIKEGDSHLTAFRTKYGSYESLVIPFGLTNDPASFQNLVNDIFADFLDIFVVVYLDDIMVFFSSEEEDVKHVASVLQRLKDNNLFAKASMCVFHASSVEYLGYVFSSDGLKMDSSKVQQILNWPQPKNIKALQSFLGFANFYCCFIKKYSKKITSLTSLIKKDSPFIFNEEALSQFQILKEELTTAPILSHFKPSLPTIQFSRNKNIHQKKSGLLKPLQIPSGTWNSSSMDFITQWPLSNNFVSILVVVDKFSKMAIFIPAYGAITALASAQIFISHVFSKHGLSQLKISSDLSTAFNPVAAGQTERVNQILEQYLQMYFSYHQDDWNPWLPLAEYAYNDEEH
ncbi:hypothetical protein O181_022397 [Austropuccinia psidii MF-1]|uniref:Reverse transcriptase domain-containing protein n=1 Tax=Austropuccinia psidii MF-1 TaxID=1389203 RepID=A0A9Q3GX32_9BASI|nr:hypothetical protein [Austropuccinia psidii MF-1]